MSDVIKPKTLSGFMELLPKEQLVFNKIRDTLESIYRLYGFLPLDTPILEYSEVLLAKAGGETEKQIYRFTKGDTDLTMRFDLTVPLAKYVAKNSNDLAFPFKRYQIGKVYRGERAQRGRFREFYQSDIDIIGDGELGIVNDAEIPSIIYEILTNLGINDFTIRINNRKLLHGLFLMLEEENNTESIMRIIDKLEKIGSDKVIGELSLIGVTDEKARKLIDFISIQGTNSEKLEKLQTMSGKNSIFDKGLHELYEVVNYIKEFNVPSENYTIDFSIARGLDYYTGTVYETILNKHPEIGSICSGGRYDNLAEFYTNKKLPGVGISIGLTRLFFILNDMNYLNKESCPLIDILVIPMTEDFNTAISFTSSLRKQGINSQIYLEDKKFKNKINFANKIGVKFVVFIGEDEIKSQTVTLKDFKTGEKETLSHEDALQRIKDKLSMEALLNIIIDRN